MDKESLPFFAKISASFIVTNILFIVEFNFNINNNIDLISLSLFSLSIPLLTPIIWLYYVLLITESKSDFSEQKLLENSFLIGYATVFSLFISIIAIGMALSTLSNTSSWIFFIGCILSFSLLLHMSFKSEKV